MTTENTKTHRGRPKKLEEGIVVKDTKQEIKPGQTIHGSKVPWTRQDVEKAFPICAFVPDETIPVTYNGVMYQLIAGVECLVPTIIRDIYQDYRRAKVGFGKNIMTSMGKVQVDPGAGTLE